MQRVLVIGGHARGTEYVAISGRPENQGAAYSKPFYATAPSPNFLGNEVVNSHFDYMKRLNEALVVHDMDVRWNFSLPEHRSHMKSDWHGFFMEEVPFQLKRKEIDAFREGAREAMQSIWKEEQVAMPPTRKINDDDRHEEAELGFLRASGGSGMGDG